MRSLGGYLALIGILFSILSGRVFATSFFPQPFPATVQDAPVIVRGKVGASNADWGTDENGARRIYTYYELQVSEGLKGNVSGSKIQIREMGGVKDGVGMEVAGASQYQLGEDVIVFLRDRNSDGSYDVQGLMMGKLSVQTDGGGDEVLSGAPLMGESNPTKQKWTVATLRRLIQSQMEKVQPSPSILPQSQSPSESRSRLWTEPQPATNPSRSRVLDAVSPASAPAMTASELHPESKTEGGRSFVLWGGVIAAVVLSAGGLILRRHNHTKQ